MPPKKRGAKAAEGVDGAKPEEEAAEAEVEADAEMKEVEAEAESSKEDSKEAGNDEAKDSKEEGNDEPKEEAKADGKEEEAKKEPEAPKEPEEPKEKEEDAPEDTRAKVAAGAVGMSATDTTLNLLPSCGGKILMTLTEGGVQYLLASGRTTLGLKAGRYMFEVKLIELHKASGEGQNRGPPPPQPHQLLRLGLSLSGSSLFLADGGTDSVAFDSEGFFIHAKVWKKVGQKFGRDVCVALLVNLDPDSPNANTVSLFKNGVRLTEPQAIPQALCGKVLYPTITYKNLTLQVNYGPTPIAPFPFACRMLTDAAAADVEVAPAQAPEGGKYDVILPVGMPEQGYFDWVDMFREKKPEYTELSDRMIIEWATKSGMNRPKQQGPGVSNDKPNMKFGIPLMDDMSINRLLAHVAPTHNRHYIIPELCSNLQLAERKNIVQKFSGPQFRRTSTVLMGEPTAEYKHKVQTLLLAQKEAKAGDERKRKAQEEECKRLQEERKKRVEEAKKAKMKKQNGEGEDADTTKMEEEEEEVKDEPMPEAEAPVELTEEEKTLSYRKTLGVDISERELNKFYASFSLPTKAEGFDEVSYVWQPEAACNKLLKDWMFEKKLTQRVEDLQPGAWFKEEWGKWTKTLQDYKRRQTDFKDPVKMKALRAKKAEERKKENAEKKKKAEEAGEEYVEENKPEAMEINVEDLDVFSVEDVNDLGNGEPLFAHFVYEDWALFTMRYEMHLLLHSFKKDLDDPDRPSFKEEHLAFYYNKYLRKNFILKSYGVDKLDEFVDLIKDTVSINQTNSFLETVLSEDTPLPNFLKLAEDHRRERQRRLDAGDETAKLNFHRPQPPASAPGHRSHPPPPAANGRQGGSRPIQGQRHGGGHNAPPPHQYGPQKRSYGGGSYGGGYGPPPAQRPRTGPYGGSSYGGAGYGGGGYGGAHHHR